MRIESAGRIRKDGTRQRKIVCTRYTLANTCEDRTRYDMRYFEQPILIDLAAMHATFAHKPNNEQATKRIANELATMKLEIKTLDESISALAPRVGASASLAERVEKMSQQLDAMQSTAKKKQLELEAASKPIRRGKEKWDFFMNNIMPAVTGDLAARERMRGLLATVDFTLKGDGEGNLLITYGGETRLILNGSRAKRRA